MIDNIMKVLNTEITTPQPWGWYHLLCLGVVLALIIIVCSTCRNLKDKQVRIILLVVGLLMLVFEVLKQLICSYDLDTGIWKYDWFYFPFQFCSVPMYVLILAGCLKPNKFRECLTSFLGTFALLGGLLVMFMPVDVFTDVLLISIHTMVHHGLMVVMGVFVYVAGQIKFKSSTILKASYVFGVIVLLAFVMNILSRPLGLEGFNVFYIGPYTRCHILVLSDIWDMLALTGETITFNNFVFLFIYVFAFALGGSIILLIAWLINLIKNKLNKNKKVETI